MKKNAQGNTRALRGIDKTVLSITILLLFFGLVTLASASSPIGFEKFNDTYHFVKRQLINGIIPGLIAMTITMYIPTHIWYKYWKIMYVVTLAFLICVFIPGLAAGFGTSASWITLGPVNLQPSELIKFTSIIALAGMLASRTQDQQESIKQGFALFIGFIGLVCGLIALQPDVGTMIVVAMIYATMYFISGAPMKFIAMLGGLGVAAIGLLVAVAPYRLARLLTFIHPEADIQGAGYQLNQALIAVGSGGLFGLGLGHSRQKFLYLPEVTSDSIFAIMAEETGFVVAVLFVGLVGYLCMRLLRLARQTDNNFVTLVLSGLVAWIAFQSIINIGAIIGIMPLTGVPLPFVSHGGSAMLAVLATIGIALRASAEQR